MAKETKKAVDNGLDKKLSQEARLKSLTQRMYAVVGVTVVVLLAFIFLTTYSRTSAAEQLETTMFLNQYRTGSKNLTTAVQSYAATGEEVYYNNYMKELNQHPHPAPHTHRTPTHPAAPAQGAAVNTLITQGERQ